ncbi:hypothetical protein ACNR9Q_13305 [Maribacter sp. X9]|uniref:hypothetical protein n=1 Tax=Maribacter sp. X9 TaxID=3402159 RepID=UPI003AF35360
MKNLKSILVVAVMAIVVAIYVIGNTAIGNEFMNDVILACTDCMIDRFDTALACTDCMIDRLSELACTDCMIDRMSAETLLS